MDESQRRLTYPELFSQPDESKRAECNTLKFAIFEIDKNDLILYFWCSWNIGK
jgi:hypothetical protein